MEYFSGGQIDRVIVASLTPGDLFLESIEEIIKAEKIETAIITSAIGSFRKFKYHTITWTGIPPKDAYYEIQGPVEIGCIQGMIVEGEPHLHVSFSNIESGDCSTGHIEHGCEVCYLVELSIAVVSDLKIKKVKDPNHPGIVKFGPAS